MGTSALALGPILETISSKKTVASRCAKVRHNTKDAAGDSARQQRHSALQTIHNLEESWTARQPSQRRPTTTESTNKSTPIPDSGQLLTLPGRYHVSPPSRPPKSPSSSCTQALSGIARDRSLTGCSHICKLFPVPREDGFGQTPARGRQTGTLCMTQVRQVSEATLEISQSLK